MSFGAVMSVMLTLAIVLGLMGVALRLLRKYTVGQGNRPGTIRMEVVQRLALGQRQGIAVVRIGTRVLAVSMGDGGVHPVAELDETELSAPAVEAVSVAPKAITEEAPSRISYVAPMEDFQAVLNIAMSGAARP